jgi:mannonate dehydratase
MTPPGGGAAPGGEALPAGEAVPWPRLPTVDGAPTITEVRTFITAPDGVNLVVVRVETDQGGLYGLGCATFTQRAEAVRGVVDAYLAPQLVGRGALDLPDIAASLRVSGYWRPGPIGNNALSGVDMALWDLLGKVAGLPVWQLLGGRSRIAVPAYAHASGPDPEATVDRAAELRAEGFRYLRLQSGIAGSTGYGAATGPRLSTLDDRHQLHDAAFEPGRYLATVPRLLELARRELGDDVELIHDVHSRLSPSDALALAAAVEPYRLCFLEDPLAPEDLHWLPRLRARSSVRIGIGELFTQPAEYLPVLRDGLIDVLRCHLSAIGGLSPGLRLAHVAELFGVHTAWHGPADVSPIGHAANVALGLASPSTLVLESTAFSEAARDVFPGTPVVRDGHLWPWTAPGLGVDFDEAVAARYPALAPLATEAWTQVRRPDGSVARP